MEDQIRLLIVEDSADDAELLVTELESGTWQVAYERVESASAFKKALSSGNWDVVLADYTLPSFSALAALEELRKTSLDIPFIIVSGTIGEETAVAAMKAGAHDYIMKNNMHRLVPAVERELRDAEIRWERKRADIELRQERDFIAAVLDTAGALVVVLDSEGRIVRFNRAVQEATGYRLDEVSGKHVWQLLAAPEVAADFRLLFEKMHKEEFPSKYEFALVSKTGDRRIVSCSNTALVDEEGRLKYLIMTGIDITERKRAEEALRQTTQTLEALVKSSPLAIHVLDEEGNVLMWNPASEKLFGYSEQEVLSEPYPLVPERHRDSFLVHMNRSLRGEVLTDVEVSRRRKDGALVYTSLSIAPLRDSSGRVVASMGIMADITNRKQAEKALMETTRALRAVVDASPAAIVTYDLDANVLMWNPAAERIFGWKAEEVLGKPTPIIPEDEGGRLGAVRAALQVSSTLMDVERLRRRKDGSLVQVSASYAALRDAENNVVGVVGLFSDITHRKRSEEELRLRAYLLDAATDSIFLHDADLGIIYCNEASYRTRGYEKEELKAMRLNDLVAPEQRPFVQSRIDELLDRGEMAYESAHVCKDGSIMPVEVHARVLEIDGKWIILNISRDMTERKRSNEKLEQSLQRLQKVLEGTVEAMSMTVEMRDPYTAGHERRVSQLACAIAQEMGLSRHEIEGIRIAGLLHDIGKIGIPAEILSKPGNISVYELNLIKTHCQVGYDILKAVEFPWPVAVMVLQHHEKIDGSGYPSGLKDGDVLPEARILAVADVVEAMASHRPYRPALSMYEALREIADNRGVTYDPEVADACLRLFAQDGFKFD